jgi:hypothetical protein
MVSTALACCSYSVKILVCDISVLLSGFAGGCAVSLLPVFRVTGPCVKYRRICSGDGLRLYSQSPASAVS